MTGRHDHEQGSTDTDQPRTGREPSADPLEILQARAREAEERRDASIAELRQLIGDDEILDEFGIDLSRLED
jgi:hypothetical protein